MLWPIALVRPIRRISLGFLPALVASSVVAGDFAYVTNQISEDVSVIDLTKGTIVSRVPVPGKPAGVAADTRGYFYTVSPDSKTVRKFDAQSAEPLNEVTLDGGPIGISLAVEVERLFVSDWYNARIWVLSADTLHLQAILNTGAAPAGLAVSPDGTLLVSADRDANQVSIFDTRTLVLQRRHRVGTRPFGLGFAPDGRLFVGNAGSDDVTVLDPQNGETLATVAVGARPYGVTFAQNRAFVSNQYSDSVSVIDLATLAPITTIDVGEYPEGIDITRDSETVVVANWFSNTINLIDAKTLKVTHEIGTGDGPRAFGKFIMQRN